MVSIWPPVSQVCACTADRRVAIKSARWCNLTFADSVIPNLQYCNFGELALIQAGNIIARSFGRSLRRQLVGRSVCCRWMPSNYGPEDLVNFVRSTLLDQHCQRRKPHESSFGFIVLAESVKCLSGARVPITGIANLFMPVGRPALLRQLPRGKS